MSIAVIPLPWYYRIAKKMILNNVRGGWRLMHAFDRLGMLKKVSKVPYFPDSQLLVPLGWSWYWSFASLLQYEPTTLRAFTDIVNSEASRTSDRASLFDCGAHIGLVSHYVAKSCPSIQSVWAFEPNASLFPILEANCRLSACPAVAVPKALSDFTGNARLVIPDGNEDGAYIVADEKGSIQVTRIDDIGVPGGHGIVMKIDVEGSELAILKGAEATLRNASFFVVLFEAHKEVMLRSGVEPMECVRFLNGLRPCRWIPSAQPDVDLDLDRPFFSQITEFVKRDVIVWSSA